MYALRLTIVPLVRYSLLNILTGQKVKNAVVLSEQGPKILSAWVNNTKESVCLVPLGHSKKICRRIAWKEASRLKDPIYGFLKSLHKRGLIVDARLELVWIERGAVHKLQHRITGNKGHGLRGKKSKLGCIFGSCPHCHRPINVNPPFFL